MRIRFEVMRQSTWMKSESTKVQVEREIFKLTETLKRHYDKVKAVYDFCETFAEGPLWTMSGGGMQLQQFYGDDNGYICILHLDMEDEPDDSDIFTIVVQAKKYNKKFKDFKYPGIEVQ